MQVPVELAQQASAHGAVGGAFEAAEFVGGFVGIGLGGFEAGAFGAELVAGGVEVRFERAAPAFHGLYDDENGVIYMA